MAGAPLRTVPSSVAAVFRSGGPGRSAAALASYLPGRRLEPSYLVVGTKRGGSTSLAQWITAHPDVAVTRAGKGTHYFDVNFSRGSRWYAAQFPRASAAGSVRTIVGESSPYYMFHPLAPQRIAAQLPDVKVVMCLRDPVERAWSHHAYEVSHGRESEDFETAIALEPTRLAGEAERLVADPSYAGDHWRFHAYLRRGHYAEQLRTYLELFEPSQILVVQSEALFAHPHEEMDRVHAFLGLAPFRAPELGPRNAGVHGEMSPSTRSWLESYYTPLNDELYALPGVDFAWASARTSDLTA